MKQRRISIIGQKTPESRISKFRKKWEKKGYHLVDVTKLLTFKLGYSGWCNDWNEPDENIYHVKIYYRDEDIGSLPDLANLDERFEAFFTNEDDITGKDFIIFMKVKQ